MYQYPGCPRPKRHPVRIDRPGCNLQSFQGQIKNRYEMTLEVKCNIRAYLSVNI